jgi:hypothetical protein
MRGTIASDSVAMRCFMDTTSPDTAKHTDDRWRAWVGGWTAFTLEHHRPQKRGDEVLMKRFFQPS